MDNQQETLIKRIPQRLNVEHSIINPLLFYRGSRRRINERQNEDIVPSITKVMAVLPE
jgi:hypothetical protein